MHIQYTNAVLCCDTVAFVVDESYLPVPVAPPGGVWAHLLKVLLKLLECGGMKGASARDNGPNNDRLDSGTGRTRLAARDRGQTGPWCGAGWLENRRCELGRWWFDHLVLLHHLEGARGNINLLGCVAVSIPETGAHTACNMHKHTPSLSQLTHRFPQSGLGSNVYVSFIWSCPDVFEYYILIMFHNNPGT